MYSHSLSTGKMVIVHFSFTERNTECGWHFWPLYLLHTEKKDLLLAILLPMTGKAADPDVPSSTIVQNMGPKLLQESAKVE
jgi:hypothetical protein